MLQRAAWGAHVQQHAGHHTVQVGLQARLASKAGVDEAGATLQQHLGGQLAQAGAGRATAGVGAEKVDHKGLHGARPFRLRLRLLRLHHGHRAATGQRHHHGAAGAEGQAVALHELAQPIPGGVGLRGHRLAAQVAFDVVGECGRRAIPALGLAAQALGQDGVQLTTQRACDCRGAGTRAGRARVFMQDRFFHRSSRAAPRPVRQRARQQLVEHGAERIDIRRHPQRAARHLLGRCVGGRQRTAVFLRHGQVHRTTVQHLGNAKVQQHGLALRRHDDVAGLDVAVDDQPPMGMRHRAHHLHEEAQPFARAQLLLLAKDIQRQAVDVFHGDVRPAAFVQPGVVQARDVRVFQQRADLALARHAFGEAGRAGDARQFERHLALECAVGTFGQPDRAHAALADLAQQPVRAHPVARLCR